MVLDLDNWFSSFDRSEQTFTVPGIEKAITYLYKAGTYEGGWGAYPSLPGDLHHSALAIQALYNWGDENSLGMRTQVALCLRRTKGQELDKLSLDDLIEFLRMARCEQNPDRVFIEQLLMALERSYSEITTTKGELSVREICSILQVMLDLGRTDLAWIQSLSKKLISLQSSIDGSWPSILGESSSILATSLAMRVLIFMNSDSAKESLARGVRYVQKQLEEKGWENLGRGSDTYTQAIVLRAVADISMINYEWVRDGICLLLARRNEDGAWGSWPNEPSNIESTALCLLALIAAKENCFVPSQLAKAALNDAQRHLIEATTERDVLRNDIEKQVNNKIKEVVQELSQLRQDRDQLRQEVDQLRQQTDPNREQEAFYYLRRLEKERMRRMTQGTLSPDFIRIPLIPEFIQDAVTAMPSLWIALSIWGIYMALGLNSLLWRIVLIVLLSLVILFVGGIWWLTYVIKRSRRKLSGSNIESTSNISVLRDVFLEMMTLWPSSFREEFSYSILSDLIHLPPDLASNYTKDIADKFPLPRNQQSDLQFWIESFLRLDSFDRRVLAEQLRRVALR